MNPFSFVAKFKTAVICGLLALVVGFGSGMYMQHRLHKAGQVDALVTQAQDSQESVNQSNLIATNVEHKQEQARVEYRTQIKEIIKYVPDPSARVCEDEAGNSIATTLSVTAVGVLNDAPESADVPTAGISDAEGQALTEVGLRELSLHIEALKAAYKELAINHDALVEYNEWYKAKVSP